MRSIYITGLIGVMSNKGNTGAGIHEIFRRAWEFHRALQGMWLLLFQSVSIK